LPGLNYQKKEKWKLATEGKKLGAKGLGASMQLSRKNPRLPACVGYRNSPHLKA